LGANIQFSKISQTINRKPLSRTDTYNLSIIFSIVGLNPYFLREHRSS